MQHEGSSMIDMIQVTEEATDVQKLEGYMCNRFLIDYRYVCRCCVTILTGGSALMKHSMLYLSITFGSASPMKGSMPSKHCESWRECFTNHSASGTPFSQLSKGY